MYYEEQIIGGRLYYRSTPTGEWILISYAKLLDRLIETENRLQEKETKMGREIRRVPSGWEHPRDEQGAYKPMLDQTFNDAIEEWMEEYRLWKEGKHPGQSEHPDIVEKYTYWEYAGKPPDPDYQRPAFDQEPTHYQIYQTVSEGTPTSPVFASLDDMKRWLIAEGFSEYAATSFVESGWAPSMVFSPDSGVSGIGIHSLDALR